ncbi:MAG: hypothetical protein ACTSQF_04185 [Candidatus Heimdallarchaeaceae archaeon]
MSKKLRRVSNIRIYVTQYAIFLLGGILFIVGIYMYDYGASVTEGARGLEISGFILLALGLVFIVLSYIYARTGARVIGTNCPLCHGTGYVDTGVKKAAKKEVCSVCNGTGKMYDKGSTMWEEEQRKQALSKSDEQTESE